MRNGLRTYQKSFIADIVVENFDKFQWIKIQKLKRKSQMKHFLRVKNFHLFKGNIKF